MISVESYKIFSLSFRQLILFSVKLTHVIKNNYGNLLRLSPSDFIARYISHNAQPICPTVKYMYSYIVFLPQIEENKQRLDDLRKQVAEKAELEWKEKKERIERQQKEERDLEEKRIRLEEMRKEQERQAERDRSLMQEEADKIRKHEEALLVSPVYCYPQLL